MHDPATAISADMVALYSWTAIALFGIGFAWFASRAFLDGLRAPTFFHGLEIGKHGTLPAIFAIGVGLYSAFTGDWIGLLAAAGGAGVFMTAGLVFYGLGFGAGRMRARNGNSRNTH